MIWDIFVMILAIYNSVTIPVHLAYGDELTIFNIPFLDKFAEIVFIFDMLVTFFTSYIDKNGKVILNSYMIAKNYVKSSKFVFDLLAVFANLPALYYFGIFKLVRIKRIHDFIEKLTVPITTKAFFKLLKLILFVVLYIHYQSCFGKKGAELYDHVDLSLDQDHWREEIWIPPNNGTVVDKKFYYSLSNEFKYILTFYYSILILGVNELNPRTELQTFGVCLSFILSFIWTNIIFGELVILISGINAQKENH